LWGQDAHVVEQDGAALIACPFCKQLRTPEELRDPANACPVGLLWPVGMAWPS